MSEVRFVRIETGDQVKTVHVVAGLLLDRLATVELQHRLQISASGATGSPLTEVQDLLSRYPRVNTTLVAAKNEIMSRFGNEAVLQVDGCQALGWGQDGIHAFVRPLRKVDELRLKYDEFESTWWVDRVDDADYLLNFSFTP